MGVHASEHRKSTVQGDMAIRAATPGLVLAARHFRRRILSRDSLIKKKERPVLSSKRGECPYPLGW